MNEYRLKVILTILIGIVFSFIFIILAFVLPTKSSNESALIKKPSNILEEVSRVLKK